MGDTHLLIELLTKRIFSKVSPNFKTTFVKKCGFEWNKWSLKLMIRSALFWWIINLLTVLLFLAQTRKKMLDGSRILQSRCFFFFFFFFILTKFLILSNNALALFNLTVMLVTWSCQRSKSSILTKRYVTEFDGFSLFPLSVILISAENFPLYFLKKVFLIFQEIELSYIFWKKSFSYISGNRWIMNNAVYE